MSNNPNSQGGSGHQRRTSGSANSNVPPGGGRSDLPYSYIPGNTGNQIHRRSSNSYARVAAGDSNRMTSAAGGSSSNANAPSSHLPGLFTPTTRLPHPTGTPSSSFPPQHYLPMPRPAPPPAHDIYQREAVGSRTRSGTVPAHSSNMFGTAMSQGENTSGRQDIVPTFFIPAYLEGSRYAERLIQENKSQIAAGLRDIRSPSSSNPGSLSTSASSVNLHQHGHSHSHSHPHIATHRLVPSYRGMTHDIIEHPPRPVYSSPRFTSAGDPPQPLPSVWNDADKHSSLDILSGGREAKMMNPPRRGGEEAGLVRADHAIPKQAGLYYFEVEILGTARGAPTGSTIAIGFQSGDCTLNRLPGWEPNSWAYHGDDGQIYQNRAEGKPYGSKYGKGDTVGCGINFRNRTAFFTRNGMKLPTAFKDIKGTVYPVIGLKNQNEWVRVNFGQEPFSFDIVNTMREEKRLITAEVDQVGPIILDPPLSERQIIHGLITQYLQHDGYAETLKALAGELDKENEALGVDNGDGSGLSFSQINTEESLDALTRQKIRSAILAGDIDTGLVLTETNYPSVFRNNDLIYFRLRCRKFIEMIQMSNNSNTSVVDESERRRGKKMSRGGGSFDHDGVFGHQMELDDHTGQTNGHNRPMSGEWESAMDTSEDPTNVNILRDDSTAQQKSGVTASIGGAAVDLSEDLEMQLLRYGAELRSAFAGDTRTEVKRELENTLALIGYTNPRKSPIADMLEESYRARLAEDLNSAILISQGKPSSAALELLIQHTEVMLAELGDDGGPGAFLNLRGDYMAENK